MNESKIQSLKESDSGSETSSEEEEEEEVLFDGRRHEESETEEKAQEESHPEGASQEEHGPTVAEKCEYCRVNRADELVQCLDCRGWYCNTKLGKSASHAIFHLVKRRHKRVSKHPQSQFGQLSFECFFCKNGNVFQLGLVPYELDQQKTFLMSCRKFFCAAKPTVSEFQLDEAKWQPLILEKQFLDFLVTCSDESLRFNSDLGLKLAHLDQFEKRRMQGAQLSIQEHRETFFEQEPSEVRRIPLTWPDVDSYCRDFHRLVECEMDEDQRQKEAVFFSGLVLDWAKATRKKKKVWVVCKLPVFEEVDINSFTNQMVQLSLPMKSGSTR